MSHTCGEGAGPGGPGVVGDERGIAQAGRAAAHRVADDAHRAEARFLPPQPDGGGAVGRGLHTTGGEGGQVGPGRD